jgi:hypothetical protein
MDRLLEEISGARIPYEQRLDFQTQLFVAGAGFGEESRALFVGQFAGGVKERADLLITFGGHKEVMSDE